MSTIPTEPPADAGDFDDVTSGAPRDPLREAFDDAPAGNDPAESGAADPPPADPEPEPDEPEAEASSDRDDLGFVKAGDADWTAGGTVTATTRAHAEQVAFDASDALQEAAERDEGVTLVCVPARFWNPRTVRTRTAKTTDWS